MTVTDTLDLLAKQASFGPRNDHLKGPHMIPFEGDDWAFATDGKAFVCVLADANTTFPPAAPEAVEKTLPLLKPKGGFVWKGLLLDLQLFAGEVKWSETCPACKGTSAVSDHVSCSFCEDDGELRPEKREGVLFGRAFDLARLAPIIAPFSGETTAYINEIGDGAALWLIGDGWRVSLMGLIVADPAAPRFSAETPITSTERKEVSDATQS